MDKINTLSASGIRTILAVVTAVVLITLTPAHQVSAQTYSVLHQFQSGTSTDGACPAASLVLGPDGYFYGTTQLGGTTATGVDPGDGTAFKMSASGSITILHNFGDGSVTNDGIYPSASLTLGSDGNFYGTTLDSSDGNAGDVFKMTPSGTVSILYEFADMGLNGKNPASQLVVGANGSFYGTTLAGGNAGDGTVFEVSPEGIEAVLHNFGDGSIANDGINPGALVLGSDGNFYGVTVLGGRAQEGTIYRMSPSGQLAVLHQFGDGTVANDGEQPNGIMQATDGNLYGTTSLGGNTGTDGGALFRCTLSGVAAVLYSFALNENGMNNQPQGSLIQSSDGNFYGTTTSTLFRATPTGTVTVIHTFADSGLQDGFSPPGPPVEGTDGGLYGTASQGGSTINLQSGAGITYDASLALPLYVTSPTIVSSTSTASSISLIWSPVAGAVGYNLYVGNSPNGEGSIPAEANITSTSGNVASLLPATKYYFKVSAVNSAGIAGPESAEYSATTTVNPPDAPTIIASTSTTNSITLTWSAPQSAVNYNLYESSSSGGEGSVPDAAGIQSTTATIPSLQPNTKYYFKVNAAGAPGVLGASSAEYSTSTAQVIPSIPTITTASSTTTTVTLSWTSATGASTYNVYAGLTSGAENPTPLLTGITASSAMAASLKAGTKYYFTVAAVNAAGTVGTKSAEYSEATAAATVPSSGITLNAGLNFFSSPYGYSGIDLDTVFGYAGVKIALWNQASYNYFVTPQAGAESVTLGNGYWIRLPQSVTLPATGTLASTSTNYDIPLAAGWTSIGDPFQTSVPLSSLLFNNGTETFNQATTGSNFLVSPVFWAYDQTTNSYVQATSLQPGQGYWVNATGATDVQVPQQ
jgi:uncharacterized repeat protein (TIGR03803 family)